MTTPTAENTPRRRRRSPESAEREILAAAESFLRERPFHEMTVDEVMARTTLSRPSFYVYFRDRNQLVIRLVEESILPARQTLRELGVARSTFYIWYPLTDVIVS